MINSELRRASPEVTTQFNFQDLITAHEQGQPIINAQMALIAGDASDRKFYRLTSDQLNAICMKFPKWEGGYGGDPMSWLGMQAALLGVGIPVPRILHIDEGNSCIWTEDFGDQFLNYKLGERTLDEADADCKPTLQLYKEALALLVKAQYPDKALIRHPAENRHFDHEKLMFEMNFFVTHFVKGWLGQTFDGAKHPSVEIINELSSLCGLLHDSERVLCHRDYHVRNVMVVNGQVRWIDFQDARMGPHTYDVVSLLRDSYIRMTAQTRISLTRYYGSCLNEARQRNGKTPWTNEVLFHEASLMGLQRNIKALGSFGYLATQKQKTGYLKYVPHTIQTILADDFAKESGMRIADAFPATIGFLSDLVQGSGRAQLESKLRSYGVADSY